MLIYLSFSWALTNFDYMKLCTKLLQVFSSWKVEVDDFYDFVVIIFFLYFDVYNDIQSDKFCAANSQVVSFFLA